MRRRPPRPIPPQRSPTIDRPDGPHDLGLIYDDDAYVELEARRAPSADGRPAGLMGRQVAGRSFLSALLRHGTWTDLAVVSRHPGAERSLERACCESPSDRLRRLPLFDEARWLGDLAVVPPARVLHQPAPLDSRYAWARQTMDPSAFALSGVTHTLCAAEAVRQLCDLVTAPFEPHDALICTSTAVARMVRSVTDDYASYLRDRHGGSAGLNVRLETIPLGVDVDRFRPPTPAERADWRLRWRIEDDEVAVLFVGRLVHHAKAHPFPMFRGVDLAARSTGRRIHLIICGWAPNRAIHEAFIDGARAFAPGVQVTFVDGMDPEARFGVWKAADLAVSLVDNLQETFGLVVAEAMACGLPIVASDWDGYRDLVDPGVTGLLVPTTMVAGASDGSTARLFLGAIDYDRFLAETSQSVSVDVASAAAAIGRLVGDDAYRRELGTAARGRAVDQLSWSRVIARYEALWAGQDAARRSSGAATTDPRAPASYPPAERSFACYPSRWVGFEDEDVAATEHAERELPRLLALSPLQDQRRGPGDDALLQPIVRERGLARPCRLPGLRFRARPPSRPDRWPQRVRLDAISLRPLPGRAGGELLRVLLSSARLRPRFPPRLPPRASRLPPRPDAERDDPPGSAQLPPGLQPDALPEKPVPGRVSAQDRLIFDGIDTEVFHRRPNVPRRVGTLDIPESTRIVTYVSRGFESMRGFDIFMRAARRIYCEHPDVLFVVVGSDRVCYGGD